MDPEEIEKLRKLAGGDEAAFTKALTAAIDAKLATRAKGGPKSFSQEEVDELLGNEKRKAKESGIRLGRAELLDKLKDLGVTDDAALEALAKEVDTTRKSKLTDAQRIAEETRATQKRLEELEARAKAAEAKADRVALFAEHGVKDVEATEALYERARQAPDFDGKTWIGEQKKSRGYLFGDGAAASGAGAGASAPKVPASTSTSTTQMPPAASGGAKTGSDPRTMSDKEYAEARKQTPLFGDTGGSIFGSR